MRWYHSSEKFVQSKITKSRLSFTNFKAVIFVCALTATSSTLCGTVLMTTLRAQEFGSPSSSNSLLCLGILQILFNYVGPGHCLFVAPVCRCWKDLYDTVESQQLQGYDAYARRSDRITCVPQMTLYSSVFASSSRVQLAHTSGLDCSSKEYHHAAGKFADITTLATAHELGM
jgi:hypothetical protein